MNQNGLIGSQSHRPRWDGENRSGTHSCNRKRWRYLTCAWDLALYSSTITLVFTRVFLESWYGSSPTIVILFPGGKETNERSSLQGQGTSPSQDGAHKPQPGNADQGRKKQSSDPLDYSSIPSKPEEGANLPDSIWASAPQHGQSLTHAKTGW
jgi:hypothetical protein